MRLIDVDALVKVKFHGYPEIEITPSDVNAEAYKRGWNDAIDAIIESAPSIDAEPQWIPCSERLPEEGKEVLISSDSGLYIAELEILEGNVYWNETIEYRSVKRVSAWMPLPEPYEAERKEK